MLTASSFGIMIVFEGMGGWMDPQIRNPFFQFSHQVLYFSFWSVALTAIYESKGRLPPDAIRVAAVLAFVSSYLMWHSHGEMKDLMADRELHILLAHVNLANAAIMAYSMRFNDSIVAYVAGCALLMAQAIWHLVVGLHESLIDLRMHDIAAHLGGLIVLMFVVIVSVHVHCVVGSVELTDQDDIEFRQSFSPLKTTTTAGTLEDEDDEDDEADCERGVDVC